MLASQPYFKGLGVALVTPFLNDNEVDYPALAKLLKHTQGVDYWVVQGTTGETATLSAEEKEDVLQFCISNNPSSKPIVLGLGGNNSKQLVAKASTLDAAKIAAILSVTPYYTKPTQAGLIAHYTAIADASTVPVILYNVPSRTGVDMLAETTAVLSHHPNIIGIKEANGVLQRIVDLKKHCTADFQIISGDDALTAKAISEQAIGAISVLGNAFPAEFGACINEALSGNLSKAEAIFEKLAAIDKLLYEEGNPTGIKGMLSSLDICKSFTRLPLLPASNNLMAKLESALAALAK